MNIEKLRQDIESITSDLINCVAGQQETNQAILELVLNVAKPEQASRFLTDGKTAEKPDFLAR